MSTPLTIEDSKGNVVAETTAETVGDLESWKVPKKADDDAVIEEDDGGDGGEEHVSAAGAAVAAEAVSDDGEDFEDAEGGPVDLAVVVREAYHEWSDIENEKEGLGQRSKDLFRRMKNRGLDPKILRKAFSVKRNRSGAMLAEEAVLLEIYQGYLDSVVEETDDE